MNSYLVERYLPGCSEADIRSGVNRVQVACAELSAGGSAIRYRGSIFLPLEEACFCRFDSELPQTVAQANERAQFPFARFTPGVAIAAAEGPHIEELSPPPHQPSEVS